MSPWNVAVVGMSSVVLSVYNMYAHVCVPMYA